MLNNTRSRCPICDSGFPLAYHLFFNDRAGLECENCNSILGHSFLCNVIKIVLMFAGAGSFGASIEYDNLLWPILTFVFVILLIYFQLFSKFKVLFNGSKYKNS